ncbi:helicase associated domain-containing protein [Arthrobacter sp. HLT1-21]
MYLRGLPPDQIARICRVPKKRVRRVLRRFEKSHPELAGKRLIFIDRPAPPTAAQLQREPSRPSWEIRLHEARKFQRRHRRLPRILSTDPVEQRLAVWVAGQRKQIRNESMSNSRQELMHDALGDWIGTPRRQAEISLWDQRLTEVADVLRREGRPPRFRRGVDQHENTLATWLVTQRGLQHRGTLDSNRSARLDERIPGWATGWR